MGNFRRGETQRRSRELRVSFFRPFYADYRIIELDPEYSCALVTGARRDFFWILSRTPVIADELLRQKVEHARHCGFPVEKLIFPKIPIKNIMFPV